MGEDLISRQAAIGIFTQLWDCIGTIMDRDEWEDVCKTTANELPSAQRNGKWIAERYMDEVDSCFYTRYKCSECGRIVYDSSLPYCHCGAEMERNEND